MSKSTMANKLPRKLLQKMAIVGEQIKLARLRRNLSMAQVAERATCSEVTLCKVEKGMPTVSIGIYLRVLYALQLDDDILLLAKDETHLALCPRRGRPSQHSFYNVRRHGLRRYCLLWSALHQHPLPGPDGTRRNALHASLCWLSRVGTITRHAHDRSAHRPHSCAWKQRILAWYSHGKIWRKRRLRHRGTIALRPAT